MVRWPPPTNTVGARCRPTGAPERRRSAYFVVSSASAIVTSTSTPDSMGIDVICFTTSDGEWRSMTRLWMRISKRSTSWYPARRLRVVMRSFRRHAHGAATFSFLSTAPPSGWRRRLQRFHIAGRGVMRMRWTVSVSKTWFSPLASRALLRWRTWLRVCLSDLWGKKWVNWLRGVALLQLTQNQRNAVRKRCRGRARTFYPFEWVRRRPQ